VLAWVFTPFISLLYGFTNLVLRAVGLEYHGEEHAVHSLEELQLLVSQSARAGLLSPPERELVQRAFAFSDQTAGEVMVPRTEIVALPAHSTVQEAVRVALRYRHSRCPVFDQTIDNVAGILSTKDLLSVAARRGGRTSGTSGTLAAITPRGWSDGTDCAWPGCGYFRLAARPRSAAMPRRPTAHYARTTNDQRRPPQDRHGAP